MVYTARGYEMSVLILRPARPKGANPRYWQGAWYTSGGRVIAAWVDEHLAHELMTRRPSIRSRPHETIVQWVPPTPEQVGALAVEFFHSAT